MLKRRARAGERGQTLILALSFIAFFALVAASVLTLASSVESQRNSTERTAAIDSVAEGSGQFAMSDSGYQACGPSSPGGSGTMSFPSTIRADTVTYNIPAGSTGCGVSTNGNADAANCELCILNSAPSGSTSGYVPVPTATTLSIGANKSISVGGEVDSNGSISGTVISTAANPRIGLVTGAKCTPLSPPACSPTPTVLPRPFLDPLAGTYLDPSNGASAQAFSSSGGLIHPGIYKSIGVTGTVWMTAGTYIDTGAVDISGNSGVLTNTDASTPNSTDGDSGGPVDSDSGGLTSSNGDSGTVSSAAAKTLTDMSKAWTAGQWVGATVSVTEGNKTVLGSVTGNTATTLTVAANWSKTPSSGDAYVITPSTVSYTATTLTDTSKNWAANQWAGYAVTVIPSGGAQETDTVKSNTATTLTMNAAWGTTPSAGNAYVISRIGYTATTVVDTSKTWSTNQWAGDVVVVTLTTGALEANFVKSNTATTLTMNAAWGTTPAGGNAYSVSRIGYTSTTLVDVTKAWATNQWMGAVVTVTLSNNSTVTDTVTSNTGNTLTMSSPWTATPSAGNTYTVLLTTVSYTSNTLTDTSKNWVPNQWVGAIVTVTLSNGSTETDPVASNTATRLTMSSAWPTWPTAPVAGNQYSLVAPVVIYLACTTSAPYWSCATGGQPGGYLATSGSGIFAIAASPSGPYAGTVLFTDPNLIDPSGGNVISVAGNGGVSVFGGTVYSARGSMSISGGGSTGTGVSISGRLIVRALMVGANGNGNSQLIFAGPGPLSSTSTCFYYTASLAGSEPNGSPINAHVRFETGCNSAGMSGSGLSSRTSIISFAYG
jgi:hypothetical protein